VRIPCGNGRSRITEMDSKKAGREKQTEMKVAGKRFLATNAEDQQSEQPDHDPQQLPVTAFVEEGFHWILTVLLLNFSKARADESVIVNSRVSTFSSS